MKKRTDPVADKDGYERHPAFGLVSVHRISATPGEPLFQSDLRHSEFIRLEVYEATRYRDLRHDWVHPGPLVCEVSMSMSQFASFVASAGTEGVPCTIEFTGSGAHGPGPRPGLNPAPRLNLTSDEVRAAAEEAYKDIQKALGTYEESLTATGPGSAAARRTALHVLQATVANAAPNVAHAAQALDRHAEEVVEKSRADIEAMVTRTAERLGVSPDSVPALEEGGRA